MARNRIRSRRGSRPGRAFWPVHLLAVLALLGPGVGFLLFAATLPQPAPPGVATDGAVVLTGGPGRLARGSEVLGKGLARRLLVSGVDRKVRPDELRAAMGLSEAEFAAVDLGFVAENTRANALEVAVWAQANGFRTIRVITSDFHARRARLEIAARLPEDVGIVVDAVPSDPELRTLLREYGKYLAAWLLIGLR